MVEFMREKLVIWGAGSTALIVADIIRLREQYEIAGFLDSVNPERAQTEFCGASVLGGEEQLDDLLQQGVRHLICGISINRVRLQLTELARTKGFQLAAAIHPQTVIASGVLIGAGTVIMAGAVVIKLAYYLRERGIYTTFRYWPLHRTSLYADSGSYPGADLAADTTLLLPIHQSLSDSEVDWIVESVLAFKI